MARDVAVQEAQAAEIVTVTTITPASADALTALAELGDGLITRVEALEITTEEGMKAASTLLADIQILKECVEDDLGGPKKLARDLWQSLQDVYKKHVDPLDHLSKRVKAKIGEFVEAEEKRRRVEAARAQERQRKVDEELRMQEAEALENSGDKEGAEEVINEEPLAPPPTQVSKPRASGVGVGKKWSASVTNMMTVIVAANEGDAIAISILTDEKVESAVVQVASAKARALKAAYKCPGTQLHSEAAVSRRGKA